MGERKVLINYIPPDFDPSIIPKTKRDKNKLCEVRTMLPFSMRCLTCGEYMYRGKKFNSRKENPAGETYLGIRKYRFYIRCSYCSAEIIFKTDPKNADYEMESGATRNFEVWRQNEAEITEDTKEREEEEEVDAMKALENRTLDSKVEMDVLDALDEIKAINQRHERVNTDALLAINAAKRDVATVQIGLTKDQEDALVKSISFRSAPKRGIDADEEEEEEGGAHSGKSSAPEVDLFTQVQRQLAGKAKAVDTIVVRKKRREVSEQTRAPAVSTSSAPPPSLASSSGLAGLFDYGSNSD